MSEELAWAAGLFEGEGYMSLVYANGDRRWPHCQLGLQTTDLDVLEHWKRVLEDSGVNSKAKIVKRKRLAAHHKQSWSWAVNGVAGAVAYELLQPYLGIRRREKGDRMLATFKQAREGFVGPRPCTQCGELFSPNKTVIRAVAYCSQKCRNRARWQREKCDPAVRLAHRDANRRYKLKQKQPREA